MGTEFGLRAVGASAVRAVGIGLAREVGWPGVRRSVCSKTEVRSGPEGGWAAVQVQPAWPAAPCDVAGCLAT